MRATAIGSSINDTECENECDGGVYGSVTDMQKQVEVEYKSAGGERKYEDPQMIVYYMDDDLAIRVKYIANYEEFAEFQTKYLTIENQFVAKYVDNFRIIDMVFFDKQVSSNILKAACERFNAACIAYIDWMYDLRKNVLGDYEILRDYVTEDHVKEIMSAFYKNFKYDEGSTVLKTSVFVRIKDYFNYNQSIKLSCYLTPEIVMKILKWWGYEMVLSHMTNVKSI